MTQVFGCDYGLSRALFYEYAAGLDRSYKKVSYLYRIVFAVFFAALAVSYWRASITASLVAGFIAAVCLLTVPYGYRFNAKMNYDRLEYLHKGTPQLHVAFGEDSIRNDSQISQANIGYHQINRIFETKQLIALVMENPQSGHQSVIVSKENLDGGSAAELLQFLHAKCQNIRREKLFDFARIPK